MTLPLVDNAAELRSALLRAGQGAVADLPLRPLPMRGVAHDHIAIEGSGLLLRIPRLSQWSLDAVANLVYQAACFTRAAPSGCTPVLHAVLPPTPGLARGALLVEHIDGALPAMPADLPAIGWALAAIHGLAVPDIRTPLLDQGNAGGPFRATLAGIEAHASFLPRAGLEPASARLLTAELERVRGLSAELDRPEPATLVGTDTHPGNFLMSPARAAARAVFVDLEKALYGAPAIDLAHATLPTSTLWDPGIGVELTDAATASLYRAWADASAPALVEATRPWLAPARRLTWLRTLFWAVRWRVLTAEDPDWSRDRVEPALALHMTRTVERLLSAEMLEHMRDRSLSIEPF